MGRNDRLTLETLPEECDYLARKARKLRKRAEAELSRNDVTITTFLDSLLDQLARCQVQIGLLGRDLRYGKLDFDQRHKCLSSIARASETRSRLLARLGLDGGLGGKGASSPWAGLHGDDGE
ncbi:hypothetical protein Pan216_16160 [Planctomycetes bacterium Pan216]|uniref:Uncharacterized protein n=1 Tax=Kolteria novifilia TaxID=2527975 RepID=A0A518B1B1_9BACT|nr:hypothetical protein Pan216_16160 [Planctomycetes bacterium Pan216]